VSRSTSEGQTHALVDVVADELRRRDREDRVELLEGALLGLGQEEEEANEGEHVEAPESSVRASWLSDVRVEAESASDRESPDLA